MAKVSAINKNNKRIKLSDRLYKKRQALKKIVMDKKISLEERFTGRPHGVYRKLKISRIALRDLGLHGLIPGMTKSSW
jgi:small subunit ribosomal protein S14